MKRIQILAILCITLISSLIIYSCSKDKKEVNDAPQKVLNFKENKISVAYASTIDNGFLNFSINIQDEESGKGIKEDFAINTDKTQLPKEISKQITEKQKALSSKFTASEISKILSVMNNMISTLTLNMADDDLLDLKVQGLFMSKSLVQSINRQILKNDENSSFSVSSIRNEFLDAKIFTSNTVYEGFNRGFSTFSLSEDLIVNVRDFNDAINQGSQSTSQEFQFIQTVLGGVNANNISVFELEQELVRYTDNNPDKFEGAPSTFGYKWPNGSDHGCCGNYDGDCYYFHPICYLHDKMCQNCKPRWFCLPGCKVDKR
jgi:hypothetical protein